MKTRNLVVSTWLGICLTVLTVGAAAEALPTRTGVVTLDIKSQPIGAALNELAQQAGIQVLFFADVANDLRVPALAGTFTPDEALIQLLSNTGLTYSYVNARTVAIHRVASTVSERKATRKEAGLPVMRLANHQQISEEPKNEITQETRGQEAGRQNSNEVRRKTRKTRKTRMEEVIVTATKRAESVQDVPISVAVITADDIDRRGLVGAGDYLRGIPGVNQTEVGYGGQAIIIRGLETTTLTQNFSGGTTTATYFGEMPTTNSAGLLGSNVDIKLVDIERVEVLRGPQGTAFGNSSMGGAVRTIPVAPKLDRFEGKVAAGYSVTSGTGGDNYNVQAVGNLPLIKDKLALRAVAYQYRDSGFYRNVAGSDAAFQATAVTPFDAQAFATDKEEVGTYYVLGGRIAALFQVSDDLRFTLSYLTQKNETDGYPGATSGRYEQTYLGVAPEHVFRGQTGGINDTEIDIANAMMEYDLGWADLLATYSYVEGGAEHALPAGLYGFLWPVSAKQLSPHRERTGEIRLATKFDGAWNFLGGLYAEKHDDVYNSDWRWFGDPATNFFRPAVHDLLDFLDRRDLKQKAAFAEVSWEFLPRFTLTGGVRAYDYERTVRIDRSGPLVGASTSTRNDSEATGNNFRANLSYKPSDDTLLYAGWAQGFRLGRPQSRVPATACDTDGDGFIDGTNVTIESTGHVDSDSVDSYELGGKFMFLHRRLMIDVALFRMDWSDLPVGVVHLPGCGAGYTANAGGALSEGVEFQADFWLTDAFRVYLGGSWIDARLTEDVPAQRWSADDRLPGSSKENANLGLQYGFDIAGHAVFVRADSIYVGSFYTNVLQSPNFKAGDYVKLDASARVEIGNLNIDFFVRNLANEDAFINRGYGIGDSYGYRLRPRTIGIQLGYSF